MYGTDIKIHKPMEQNREHRYTSNHYGQLIFDKDAKKTQWGKDILFNKRWQENWTSTSRE